MEEVTVHVKKKDRIIGPLGTCGQLNGDVSAEDCIGKGHEDPVRNIPLRNILIEEGLIEPRNF